MASRSIADLPPAASRAFAELATSRALYLRALRGGSESGGEAGAASIRIGCGTPSARRRGRSSASSTPRRALDQPLSTSSAALGTVAVGYVLAAVCAGPLGDAFGPARVILVAPFAYGAGLLVAGLARE